MDLVVSGSSVRFIGCVTQGVLIAQFLVNGGVDLVDGLLFGNFKEAAARLSGYLLEDFFPIGARFFRISTVSTAAHSTSVAAAVAAAISSVLFLISEKDRVNKSVRALGRFDAVSQTFFAAAVHSIRKDDEGFASLLLFRDFIRCEVYRVIKQGAAPSVTVPIMIAPG